MICVKFQRYDGSQTLITMVSKTISMRDLQKGICSFFNESFPKKAAKLKVYGKTYDDFGNYPFEDVIGEDVNAIVDFEDTTDPYFYDVQDRLLLKCTLADEIQWEDEVENELTTLALKDWLLAKKQLVFK